MVAGFVTLPLAFLTYLVPSASFATIAMTGTSFALALTCAAITTLPFGLARSGMRGLVYAVYSIGISLGWGFGPVVAGYVSAQLEPIFGADSLRYALLVSASFFALWASAHFFLAAHTYVVDCKRANAV